MRLLEYLPLHLTLVISLGSAFILFPEDLITALDLFQTKLPQIRFGMNLTKVGVGFRLGRNVDFQTLVEMGSLITTTQSPSKRNVRQQLTSDAKPPQHDVSGQPEADRRQHFISSLWGRRPAIRAPTRATKPPTSTARPTAQSPELNNQLPDHDVTDNEIEP